MFDFISFKIISKRNQKCLILFHLRLFPKLYHMIRASKQSKFTPKRKSLISEEYSKLLNEDMEKIHICIIFTARLYVKNSMSKGQQTDPYLRGVGRPRFTDKNWVSSSREEGSLLSRGLLYNIICRHIP